MLNRQKSLFDYDITKRCDGSVGSAQKIFVSVSWLLYQILMFVVGTTPIKLFFLSIINLQHLFMQINILNRESRLSTKVIIDLTSSI